MSSPAGPQPIGAWPAVDFSPHRGEDERHAYRQSGDHPDDVDRRQGLDARQARALRPGGGLGRRPGDLLPGAVLRALLRDHRGRQVLRLRRAGRRPDRAAVRRAGRGAVDGDGAADLRGGPARRLLQHRGGGRRRRHDPRQVPQAPHPEPRQVLGEVLLPSRQPGLSGVQDRGRADRGLHLLRPALPGGLARARPERRPDRLQPERDQAGAVEPAVGDRAAGGRRRERLLRRRAQPGRARGQRVRRPGGHVLRLEPVRRPAGQPDRRDGQRDRRGGRDPRPRPRHDPGGPQRLAVLPRPPAGLLHHDPKP